MRTNPDRITKKIFFHSFDSFYLMRLYNVTFLEDIFIWALFLVFLASSDTYFKYKNFFIIITSKGTRRILAYRIILYVIRIKS